MCARPPHIVRMVNLKFGDDRLPNLVTIGKIWTQPFPPPRGGGEEGEKFKCVDNIPTIAGMVNPKFGGNQLLILVTIGEILTQLFPHLVVGEGRGEGFECEGRGRVLNVCTACPLLQNLLLIDQQL